MKIAKKKKKKENIRKTSGRINIEAREVKK